MLAQRPLFALLLTLTTGCPDKSSAPPRDGNAHRPAVADLAPRPWEAGATASRIVAIGDLHGDLATTRAALRLAGAIDERDRWIGGGLVVVQLGDQLDRGDEDRQVLELFDRLADEAGAGGGRVISVLGNHETMNVAGSMGYVTDGGFAAFEGIAGIDVEADVLRPFPAHERARRAAFLPGGPYARRLTERDVVVQLGETVFAHGGVLPSHVGHGLARINAETRRWIAGEAPQPSHVNDGPLWTTRYSSPVVPAEACAALGEVLTALGAKRMVVAHVVQGEGINTACDGQVWRVDVGLSRYYGGPLEVLELTGGRATPLSASKTSPGD